MRLSRIRPWRPATAEQGCRRLFTWDGLHGKIEVFDLLGRHLAALKADGERRKGPFAGRRIDAWWSD
jgi:hypothetical protein